MQDPLRIVFITYLSPFLRYKRESSEAGSTACDETEEESDLLTAFHKVVQKSPAAATVPEQKSSTQTSVVPGTVKGSGVDSI